MAAVRTCGVRAAKATPLGPLWTMLSTMRRTRLRVAGEHVSGEGLTLPLDLTAEVSADLEARA